MPFEIVRNDITNMHVDAIVNAASRYPRFNPGVDAAIHKKAGPSLLAARQEIGFITPGTAAITPAFDLSAKYVIHAVTPCWEGGNAGELKLLRSTYDQSLQLALEHQCETVAFPLLASGNNGFPKDQALQVAIAAFSEFLLNHELQIYLVVFGEDCVKLSEKLFHNIASYIDRHYVQAYECDMLGMASYRSRAERKPRRPAVKAMEAMPAPTAMASVSLNEFVKKKDKAFTETLLDMIKERGLKNSAVYKKASISKQHFSKLINDPAAKPSKATALALAVALELNVEQTKDLIGRAGYALTDSSTFDLIVRYFIEHQQYNIVEINIALYEFDQSLLGA